MTTARESLAAALHRVICDVPGCPGPMFKDRHLADAALTWLAEQLHREDVREVVAERLHAENCGLVDCDHILNEYEPDADAALAALAEVLGASS